MKEKIAIVSPGFKPVPAVKGGAVETLITYIIDGNELNHNYDIDLYTIYDEQNAKCDYITNTICMIKINYFLNLFYRLINYIFRKIKINKVILDYPSKVLKAINKVKYSKIIVENNMELYKIIYKKYNHKCQFFFHLHNNINEPGNNKKNSVFIARTAKEIIFVSNALKKSFDNITSSSRGIVLYNSINFKLYDGNLNNHYISSNKSYSFIFTGRICSDKGVKELLTAFLNFNKKYPNTELTIVGFDFKKTNLYEKKIIKLATKNKNVHLIRFLKSEELVKYVKSSDCVVIPSMYEEAFGVVALEAMAMGKTIIATNAGGLIEPLNDECAIIIERKNIIENLYKAMEKIYNDKEYAQKLAQQAFQRVHEIKEFDKDNYFANFLNIVK